MGPKSVAQRSRDFRIRRASEGDAFKVKEQLRHKRRRANLSMEQKERDKAAQVARMRHLRAQRKEAAVATRNLAGPVKSTFTSPSSQKRALYRLVRLINLYN